MSRKRPDERRLKHRKKMGHLFALNQTIKTKPSEGAKWQMAHRAYGGAKHVYGE